MGRLVFGSLLLDMLFGSQILLLFYLLLNQLSQLRNRGFFELEYLTQWLQFIF